MDNSCFVKCSVVTYRYGTSMLYLLGEEKEETEYLHGKSLLNNDNSREVISNNVNKYETKSNFARQ